MAKSKQMQQMPKYMAKKVERMNRLMSEIVDLNLELEDWMEANGIDDSFDFTYDHRDDRGYAIIDITSFIEAVNEAMSE